ncbi:hypothetical protein BDV95DRAFT_568376 [Massariosphaeria phaeospora]|uniref:Uncharacterized protein n=1 Tax=Massariosphaeria phaeospora TaxID=100035 RepID=A0A7C8I9W4_9PLEO|nr:hypothetical protein BDV95DRAFT_568376 [Massariosphaeria phaeospora]
MVYYRYMYVSNVLFLIGTLRVFSLVSCPTSDISLPLMALWVMRLFMAVFTFWFCHLPARSLQCSAGFRALLSPPLAVCYS